jgi:hypothetical protein
VIVLCSVAFLAYGCGSDVEPAPATSEPTTTAPTPTATPCVVEGATTGDKQSHNQPPHSPMVEVRTSGTACPRVVFEFEGQVSGYDVRYIEPPLTDCGSGEETDTSTWDANAFLEVRLEPSGGPDITSEEGEPTYKGARDIDVEEDAILKHLTVTCDFEAVFTWAIGVDQERPFNVMTLQDPPRLVVEISEAADADRD